MDQWSNLSERYFQVIPKIPQRYPQDIPKISQDIPEISPRYLQDSPKISPRDPQYTEHCEENHLLKVYNFLDLNWVTDGLPMN